MKKTAKILDATAGLRSIWSKKRDSRVLFIDIETELEYQPDLIMDSRKTDFKDKRYYNIFFDPPHYWGAELGNNQFALRNKEEQDNFFERRNYKNKPWGLCSYYGADKYKTKQDLMNYIVDSQKEFYRILDDNGCLWVKWAESKIKIDEIISLFVNWEEMMRFYIQHPKSSGKTQTYWIMFMKREDGVKQLTL